MEGFDALDAFLKEQNKIEFSGDMRKLMHYPFEKGLQMLEVKQRFVSFLLSLQNMTPKDYHLFASHAVRAEEYIYLLYEWVLNSSIFSEKELGYCPKLRDPHFVNILKNLRRDGLASRFYAIFYVVAYQIKQ